MMRRNTIGSPLTDGSTNPGESVTIMLIHSKFGKIRSGWKNI